MVRVMISKPSGVKPSSPRPSMKARILPSVNMNDCTMVDPNGISGIGVNKG